MKQRFYAHPKALVESKTIGAKTKIWGFTHIMPNVTIGQNCNVGEHCFVESGVSIGDNVTIKNGNSIWTGITIDHGVFVGPAVVFTNDRYPRSPRLPQACNRYSNDGWLVRTTIRTGASLGAASVILPGVSIGEYAMVGASALVTEDVPPHALVVGSPAHVVGWVCWCGQPLKFLRRSAVCRECGTKWSQSRHNGVAQET